MNSKNSDLPINCPICSKPSYYYNPYDLMQCKTCRYYYYYYGNDIFFRYTFERKSEIVCVDVTYEGILQKYLYNIEYRDKSNYKQNEIYLELDIFLNKKQINKIIDNQIFA